MKARCKCYKPMLLTKNSAITPDRPCSADKCPGSLPPFHYCMSGFITMNWIDYIKYSNQFSLFFNFEDIIYDRI